MEPMFTAKTCRFVADWNRRMADNCRPLDLAALRYGANAARAEEMAELIEAIQFIRDHRVA